MMNTSREITSRNATHHPFWHLQKVPSGARCLSENLFEKTPLDSDIGRQSLEDIVALYKSTERVVYYPKMSPVSGCCPIRS